MYTVLYLFGIHIIFMHTEMMLIKAKKIVNCNEKHYSVYRHEKERKQPNNLNLFSCKKSEKKNQIQSVAYRGHGFYIRWLLISGYARMI